MMFIIQTQGRFFFFPGGGWQSGALYLHIHCTQAVPDNVYLISSECKEVKSKNSSTLLPYKVISVQIFIQNKHRSTCKQ